MSALAIFQLVMALLTQIAPLILPLLGHHPSTAARTMVDITLDPVDTATLRALVAHVTVKP